MAIVAPDCRTFEAAEIRLINQHSGKRVAGATGLPSCEIHQLNQLVRQNRPFRKTLRKSNKPEPIVAPFVRAAVVLFLIAPLALTGCVTVRSHGHDGRTLAVDASGNVTVRR
jgi:hypothetical protein